VNAPLASLQRAACAHGEDLPLVLADASLVAHAGELVVLIGKNGSGKSTLLSAMAGLLPLRSGRALLGDREAAALSRRERALRVAIVPQDAPPLFDVLAFDFVLAGRYARLPRWRRAPEEDLRAAQEALQACGAGDDGCKPLFELSGGARRRVLVARAIAQGAPLLLADEPTNALDPEHKLQVFDLRRAVRRPHRLAPRRTRGGGGPARRDPAPRGPRADLRSAPRLRPRGWRSARLAFPSPAALVESRQAVRARCARSRQGRRDKTCSTNVSSSACESIL
jgi:ABC-type cobalamin/Fe3+-siderophores transport system ATPase subunit